MYSMRRARAGESKELFRHPRIGWKLNVGSQRIAQLAYHGCATGSAGKLIIIALHGTGQKNGPGSPGAAFGHTTYAMPPHQKCWQPGQTLPPLRHRWAMQAFRQRQPRMPTSHLGAKSAPQTYCQVWCSLVQKKALTIERKGLILLVPRDRIELPTRGFSVPCSTN